MTSSRAGRTHIKPEGRYYLSYRDGGAWRVFACFDDADGREMRILIHAMQRELQSKGWTTVELQADEATQLDAADRLRMSKAWSEAGEIIGIDEYGRWPAFVNRKVDGLPEESLRIIRLWELTQEYLDFMVSDGVSGPVPETTDKSPGQEGHPGQSAPNSPTAEQGNQKLSARQATALYAKLTGTKPDKRRAQRELRDTDGSYTLLSVIRKAKPIIDKKPMPTTGEHTCPECHLKTDALLGPKKLCRNCLVNSLGIIVE